MKKVIKSNIKVIIAVFITLFLSVSVTIYATSQYYAKDILFQTNNSDFKSNNVEDALNELY